jgi:hypothetical protein
VVTYNGLRRLWRPPAETLEALTSALGQHWRAAASSQRLFWPAPVQWLKVRTALNVVPAPVTISPQAADSSGRHPDPRRY